MSSSVTRSAAGFFRAIAGSPGMLRFTAERVPEYHPAASDGILLTVPFQGDAMRYAIER
jgi:hypothetical protein